jgi:hypothetical protein
MTTTKPPRPPKSSKASNGEPISTVKAVVAKSERANTAILSRLCSLTDDTLNVKKNHPSQNEVENEPKSCIPPLLMRRLGKLKVLPKLYKSHSPASTLRMEDSEIIKPKSVDKYAQEQKGSIYTYDCE